MNAHYEKGRYFVPRRVPGEETVFEPEDEVQSYINQQFVTKGCQLVHYNVLIDSHNNLVYDFVWLSRRQGSERGTPGLTVGRPISTAITQSYRAAV